MKDKLFKYLLRLCKDSFVKENESGSVYFLINGINVRLSDHMSSVNKSNLQIVVPVNSDVPIIILSGRVIIMPNYNKVKEFIRNFVFISQYSSLIRVEVREVVKEEELSVTEKEFLALVRGIKREYIEGQLKQFRMIYNSQKNKAYRKSRADNPKDLI